MSGRGRGRANTRGGRGRGRGSQGRGTTRATATSRNNIKTGATKELGSHIYDYGSKAAADQMKTTTEQIVLHAGSKFGEDISTESEPELRSPSLRLKCLKRLRRNMSHCLLKKTNN